MLSLEQAKDLTHGDIVYHVAQKNADQTPQRWRINGKVKLWKRSPNRIQIPIKHGLYSYDYLTEQDLTLVCLTEQEAEIVTDPGSEIGRYCYLLRNVKHTIPIYGCLIGDHDRLMRSVTIGGDRRRSADDEIDIVTGGFTYYYDLDYSPEAGSGDPEAVIT